MSAQEARRRARAEDTYCVRFCGRAFAIVMNQTDDGSKLSVLGRILDSTAEGAKSEKAGMQTSQARHRHSRYLSQFRTVPHPASIALR